MIWYALVLFFFVWLFVEGFVLIGIVFVFARHLIKRLFFSGKKSAPLQSPKDRE